MVVKRLKIEINKDLPLKLFFFLVSPAISVSSIEEIELCLGYELEEVLNEMKYIYMTKPIQSVIRPVGSANVDMILEAIETKKKISPKMEFKFVEPAGLDTEKNLAYICSLRYAKDNFCDILNDTDNKALKRIINKIDKHLAYDTK